MPQDVSPSSSEDEAGNPKPEAAVKRKESARRSSAFQCPADFVTFRHQPCSGTFTGRLEDEDCELWLIKAPLSFEPQRFGGVKVPLAGLRTLKVPADGGGGGEQIYSVLASSRGTSELRLLTSGRGASGGGLLAPAFSGLLNVCESYGGGGALEAPRVVPTPPPPSVPPGLKQRFHPFGSKTPMPTCETEVDGAATLRPPGVKRRGEDDEEEEGRKKKKKHKKEKQMKAEHEAVEVKQEAVMEEAPPSPPEEEEEEQWRKKKKKKKDREQQEEDGDGPEPSAHVKQEAVAVKSEPPDASYEHAAGGSSKKKKKKRSRTENE